MEFVKCIKCGGDGRETCALEKVRQLVACLKDAAITCKEKNALKSGDASYWLGAENAYLQVVKSVERVTN